MSLITSNRKRFALVFVVLSIPTFLLSTAFISVGGDDGLKIGKNMPLSERLMAGIDGQDHSLDQFVKENGLIVIFSCNTCPFVVGNDNFEGWEKQYNALYERASVRNIGLVLINSNEAKRDGDDSMKEMISHAKEAGYKMPYVVDEKSELADALGAKTTPHVFAFSADKKLIYKGSIDNTWDSKRTEVETYLYHAMDNLDGGKKLKENSTTPRGCSIKRVKVN
jgi:hypothetical protein